MGAASRLARGRAAHCARRGPLGKGARDYQVACRGARSSCVVLGRMLIGASRPRTSSPICKHRALYLWNQSPHGAPVFPLGLASMYHALGLLRLRRCHAADEKQSSDIAALSRLQLRSALIDAAAMHFGILSGSGLAQRSDRLCNDCVMTAACVVHCT